MREKAGTSGLEHGSASGEEGRIICNKNDCFVKVLICSHDMAVGHGLTRACAGKHGGEVAGSRPMAHTGG